MQFCPHFQTLIENPLKIKQNYSEKIQCSFQHNITEIEPQSLYLCLQCGQTGCNWYSQNQCMLKHIENTSHFLTLNIETFQVWCNKCDSFVDEYFEYPQEDQSQYEEYMQHQQQYIEFIQKVQDHFKQETKEQLKTEVKNVVINSTVFGLQNLGNTCFLNSILQCLLASQSFSLFLQQKEQLYQQSGLLKRLYNLNELKNNTKNPSEILKQLSIRNKKFSALKQQDANEAFIYLMDILEAEIKKQEGKIEHPFIGYYVYMIQCLWCHRREFFFEKSSAILQDLKKDDNEISEESFHKLKNNNKNPLKISKEEISMHQNVKDSGSNIYNLEMQPLINLEDDQHVWFIYDYFKPSIFTSKDTGYWCEHCKEKSTSAQKRYFILKPPKILVICFKRFQSGSGIGFRKNEEIIQLPETLDLQQFSLKEEGALLQANYRLYGSVQHQGTLNYGHYISYVNKNNQWYYISDSHVCQSNLQEVQNSQCYLAFYELLDN